jgi:hypothetical protein
MSVQFRQSVVIEIACSQPGCCMRYVVSEQKLDQGETLARAVLPFGWRVLDGLPYCPQHTITIR